MLLTADFPLVDPLLAVQTIPAAVAAVVAQSFAAVADDAALNPTSPVSIGLGDRSDHDSLLDL